MSDDLSSASDSEEVILKSNVDDDDTESQSLHHFYLKCGKTWTRDYTWDISGSCETYA